MAKKFFRIESLTPDERNILLDILKGDENLLAKIEKTGEMPAEVVSGRSANEIAKLQPLFAKLKGMDRGELIRKFIKEQGDETGLSEEALRERLQGFQELGVKGKTGSEKRNEARDEIKKGLDKYYGDNISDEQKNNISGELADRIANGEIKTSQELLNFAEPLIGSIGKGGGYQDIVKDFSSKFGEAFSSLRGEPEDTSEDVTRIQDLISGFESTRAKEGQIQSFLAQTPEELRQDREKHLAGLESSGQRYLSQKFLPSALKELTRRGIASNVGELTSLLASETGKVQERIEQEYASLEQEDNLFFADAAFRLQQAKLDMAEDDYRRQVDFERTKTRQEQQQRFTERERAIQSDFDKNILQRDLERKRSTGVTDIELGKKESESRQSSGNIATIGESTTNVVGSYLTRDKLPERKG